MQRKCSFTRDTLFEKGRSSISSQISINLFVESNCRLGNVLVLWLMWLVFSIRRTYCALPLCLRVIVVLVMSLSCSLKAETIICRNWNSFVFRFYIELHSSGFHVLVDSFLLTIHSRFFWQIFVSKFCLFAYVRQSRTHNFETISPFVVVVVASELIGLVKWKRAIYLVVCFDFPFLLGKFLIARITNVQIDKQNSLFSLSLSRLPL